MRVVCENCGATYKIPDTKLVKAVNKATCRKCGFKMMIQRPRPLGAAQPAPMDASEAQTVMKDNPAQGDVALLEAKTQIGVSSDRDEWSDEAPTQVQVPDGPPSPAPDIPPHQSIPRPDTTAPRIKVPTTAAPRDMVLAMIGAFSSAGGALLLAVNISGSSSMRFIGLAVALWGSLTTLFILVTGNIGRHRGNIPMSLGLGTALALGAAVAIQLATTAQTPEPVASVEPEAVEAPTEIMATLAAEALEAAEEFADAAEEIAEAVEEVVEAAPEEIIEEVMEAVDQAAEVVAALPPDPEAERRAEEERRRQEEAERRRREEAAARAAPPPPVVPPPPKLKTVPLSVVDTLIRTNLSIKRCFFQEKQRSGQLPRRVTVRFSVQPTGRVTSAQVATSEYQGGPLDQCLSRAFRSIQFPPFDGEPLNMTYPFVL